MSSVATKTSNQSNLFSSDFTFSDHSKSRDSLTTEYQCPIEEAESISTASELGEPLTPISHTSETASFSHAFHYHDSADDALAAPKPAAPSAMQPKPLSTASTNPDDGVTWQNQQPPPPEKSRFVSRVSSFVRSRLHKIQSHKESTSQPDIANLQDAKAKVGTKNMVTGVERPTEITIPVLDSLKPGRRLSAFSLARSSAKSSRANTPPLSNSPTSTRSIEQKNSDRRMKLSKKPSSTKTLSGMGKSNSGITWAVNINKSPKRHSWLRRPASTELLSGFKEDEDRSTAGMLNTFSKPANKGVGMRARRLSLHLPDQYIIDWCELDREFKSSSLMPGKKGKVLGRGATAEVRIMARKGATKDEEELVAVKIFRERDPEETEEDYVMKIKSEYSIAKSLHHPNIVETVRLCTNRGRWNHVMEFCTYGEVFSLVERRLFAPDEEGFYNLEDRLCFFKQLLRGVEYLHSHGIAHRDIKLENLLLSKEGHLKISDFGVAEVFSGEHPGLRASGGECGKNMGSIRLSSPGVCGSLPYIAPEVLEKRDAYDPRPLDIWSCAIVFLTMTFGGCPWQAAKPEFEYYARFKKGWDAWLEEHPDGTISNDEALPKCGKLFNAIDKPSMKVLILKMLHPLPAKRITIRELMKTSFMKNIECCTPETFDDSHSCIDVAKSGEIEVTKKKYMHHHIPPKESKIIQAPFRH